MAACIIIQFWKSNFTTMDKITISYHVANSSTLQAKQSYIYSDVTPKACIFYEKKLLFSSYFCCCCCCLTNNIVSIFASNDWYIYTTKGREPFHWAATPLKPYKVANISYMTYRYTVLYFLNLSLKHYFPHRKRQFVWKYPNPRMPNRRTSQSKIEDIVHCKCISLLN